MVRTAPPAGQARPWREAARGEIVVAVSLPAGRLEARRGIGILTVAARTVRLLRIAGLRGAGWPCGLAEIARGVTGLAVPVLIVTSGGVTILGVGALAVAVLRVSTGARGRAEAVLGRDVLAGIVAVAAGAKTILAVTSLAVTVLAVTSLIEAVLAVTVLAVTVLARGGRL